MKQNLTWNNERWDLEGGLSKRELLALVRYWFTNELDARYDEWRYAQTFGAHANVARLDFRIDELTPLFGERVISQALQEAFDKFEADELAQGPVAAASWRVFQGKASPEEVAIEARTRQKLQDDIASASADVPTDNVPF